MDLGAVKTNNGRIVLLHRYINTSPTYSIPSQFSLGINGTVPQQTDTALTFEIPILTGTPIEAGTSTLIGSESASNSTANTATYKEGCNLSDYTAQNLIKSSTASTACTWTLTLSNFPSNLKYTGLWIYISDTTKLATAQTAFEMRLGSDSSNYYHLDKISSDFSNGWNFFKTSSTLGSLPEQGTVSGNIDTFIIRVRTASTATTFSAGELIYDLLRQWQDSDLVKSLESSTLDESALSITHVGRVSAGLASGFLVNQMGIKNTDSPNKLTDLNTHDAESKGDEDIFVYTFVERLL